jgi:hypothetical protein
MIWNKKIQAICLFDLYNFNIKFVFIQLDLKKVWIFFVMYLFLEVGHIVNHF